MSALNDFCVLAASTGKTPEEIDAAIDAFRALATVLDTSTEDIASRALTKTLSLATLAYAMYALQEEESTSV